MAAFYDTHAHLDYPDFEKNFEAVLARARDAEIVKMISIGTDFQSSWRAVELSAKYPQIYAVVGWHPSDALAAPDDIHDELRKLAQQPKVVALGETGLDYYRLPSGKDGGTEEDDARYKAKQAGLFAQHLEVAKECGLNCVIHQRSAFEDTVRQLEPFSKNVRGVFHCFVGTPEEQRRVQALGSLVSFTGIATFKNAAEVRETIAATPLDQLMLETDCPYLAPMPYRGKRCEPAYVKEISEVVAATKNCSLEELSHVTCETAHEFFRGLEQSNG